MLFANRYEFLKKLGAGGFGAVYLARDHKTNTLVAIKLVRADLSVFRRFVTEALAMLRLLDHPNIVRLLDLGDHEHEGRPVPYIAMEYVDGRSLRDALSAEGPFSVEAAVTIIAGVGLGAWYLHQNKIIHRDLKPDNVLIRASDERVKIGDLGIAKLLDAIDDPIKPEYVIGTRGYMAPEQAAGRRAMICPATDIYSMGVILHELVVGEIPRAGRLSPALPRELVPICTKCLQENLRDRYRSAIDFTTALHPFLKTA